ncbi:MAG: hypothetical protein PHX74_08985 [Candidatus Sumerlaeales bacterium]|nr:hypothetical protein [Candidatus Sumerlaeales bacterium]
MKKMITLAVLVAFSGAMLSGCSCCKTAYSGNAYVKNAFCATCR